MQHCSSLGRCAAVAVQFQSRSEFQCGTKVGGELPLGGGPIHVENAEAVMADAGHLFSHVFPAGWSHHGNKLPHLCGHGWQ